MDGLVRHEAASYDPPPQTNAVELFAGMSARQAKFYVSGERAGLGGRVVVAILVQQQGLLRGAVATAAAIALLLVAVVLEQDEALAQVEATVAVLLLAPAILGYLLVRPSEHVPVGGFLAGVRRLTVVSGVWPVLTAVFVTLHKSVSETLLTIILGTTAAGAGLTCVLLFASLRIGGRLREKYAARPENMLADSH